MLKRTLDWHPALAEAIRELDGARFAPALARALRQVAPFDYNVVFGYRGEDRPLDLYDDFGPHKRDIFVIDVPGRALSARPVLPRQPQRRRARPLPHARPGAGPLLSERILPVLLRADRADRGDRLFPGDRRRRAGGHLADARRPFAVLQHARDGGAACGGAGGDRRGGAPLARPVPALRRRAGDLAGGGDAARGLRAPSAAIA